MTLLLALAPASVLGADSKPPEKMAFQGFLTDQNGVARGQNTPQNLVVTFRLYKTATAAANQAVWSEQQTVTVDKGHFSVVLGDGVLQSGTANFSAHFSGNDTDAGRYLGVTVSGETEISPRIQFFTAPYASLARYATELVGTSGSSVLKVTGNQAGINLVGAPTTTLDVGGIVTATGLDVNGTSTLDGTTTVAGSLRVTGNNVLELGSGVAGKDGAAGKIGYGTFTTGVLDIVGAGTTGTTRAVKIWAEAGTTFTGPVSAPSFSGTQTITAGGLRFDNSQLLQAKNSAGTYENFLWPRWSDNVTYMNYGSGGFNIRNNTSTETMFMKDNGNVGLGTTDPTYKLHVNGPVAIQNSSVLQFGQGYTREGSAGQIGYGTHSGGASGSLDIVGAGTTGSNRKVQIWAEGGLTLNGPISNGLTVKGGAGDAFHVYTDFINVPNYTDKGKSAAMYRQSDGLVMWLRGPSNHSTGDRYALFNGDSNWDFSSDRKLKKDIEDAEPMLDRALKVQLRRFRWKTDAETNRLNLGVIAQELLPLFPDMVSEMEPPRGEGEKTLAVGYSDFGMIAIKAIQEFKARHDAEVKDLKAQVAELGELRGELAKARGEKQSLAENLSAMDARLVRLEKVLKQQAALSPQKPEAGLVQVSAASAK